MGIIKKIIFYSIVLTIVALGSMTLNGNDLIFDAGGILGMLLACIVVYIFFKLVMKAIGCLPALLIIFGIIFFILYTIGALNGGVDEIIPNIKNFIATKETPQEDTLLLFEEDENPEEEVHISETFDDNFAKLEIKEENSKEKMNNIENFQEHKIEEPTYKNEEVAKPVKKKFNRVKLNPKNYPAIYGKAKVISADTLLIRNHVIRLYGIAAPLKQQACADSRGHPYACGKKAARWLQNWILDGEIECRILQKTKQNLIGICSYGQYDLGAALVVAGWAVALPKNEIYEPYEEQAQRNLNGMWSGTFYKPWDWADIQAQKPKIKVIKPKTSKKRFWDYL